MTADLRDVLAHAIQVGEKQWNTPKELRSSIDFREVVAHFAVKAEEVNMEKHVHIPNALSRDEFEEWENEYLEMIKDKSSLTWKDWGNILSATQSVRLTFIEQKR